eukprot:365408-Chlamydomonas_euryale.AAC.28
MLCTADNHVEAFCQRLCVASASADIDLIDGSRQSWTHQMPSSSMTSVHGHVPLVRAVTVPQIGLWKCTMLWQAGGVAVLRSCWNVDHLKWPYSKHQQVSAAGVTAVRR